MKAAKWALAIFLVYVALVAAFETFLGTSQPSGGGTITITTFDADGTGHDRVVSRLELDGRLYVAANHWPRAWYRRVLDNPEMRVSMDGVTEEYVAVVPGEDEVERVDEATSLGFVFRILTGFPPRRILRLDPA